MTDLDLASLDTTDWIAGSVKPVHEGVYERRMSDGPFSCWNGAAWNADADSPAEAAGRSEPSRDQHASWRGLVAPSDLPCATCKGHTVIDRGHDAETGDDLITECPDC